MRHPISTTIYAVSTPLARGEVPFKNYLDGLPVIEDLKKIILFQYIGSCIGGRSERTDPPCIETQLCAD